MKKGPLWRRARGTIDGEELYQRGVKAFTDFAPVNYSSQDGLYRTRQWGNNLELFFLDERSFRSAKASKDGVCDNPATNAPDLAPTAPQSTRNLFAVLVPSLAQPVSQACLDAINDPSRTFLGDKQLKTFVHDIEHSHARFKVVINELPIQQYYALPYDRWEGYEAERQRVLSELQGVKNVVFLTADVHATLVNDARFKTLEPGGPVNSGILDVTVGPAATASFGLEINDAAGSPAAAAAVDAAVLRAAAAGRGRDAVLGPRSVQLRRGGGDQLAAHDHAQGDRREPADDRRRRLRALRLELPALTRGRSPPSHASGPRPGPLGRPSLSPLRERVSACDPRVEAGAGPRRALEGAGVERVEPELRLVAVDPFEVVGERPVEVAAHVGIVLADREQQLQRKIGEQAIEIDTLRALLEKRGGPQSPRRSR